MIIDNPQKDLKTIFKKRREGGKLPLYNMAKMEMRAKMKETECRQNVS